MVCHPSEELIENVKEKHPDLKCGMGCVRIRDKQDVPLAE